MSKQASKTPLRRALHDRSSLHPAVRDGQVATVIRKQSAAREQLAEHLRDGARISKWLWVASGRVHFAKTEKATLILAQNGIEFVGTKVLAKHLPVAAPAPSTRSTTTRGKRKR